MVAGERGGLHDLLMTVDTYWRRVDPDAVQGLEPPELRALVPFHYDDRFQPEMKAHTTVLAEDTGSLICRLLRLGADNDADDYAAWLAVRGADGVGDDQMIGVLTPEEVIVVAEFLSGADPAAWMQQFRAHLAVLVQKLGYRRPFDDEWARTVVADTKELTALFGLAAAAGEAVIVMVVA
jgi:hypothetical protein